MCLFVESIQLNNGEFKRLELHQERIRRAMSDYYPTQNPFELESVLSNISYPPEGLYKCRIVYDTRIHSLEFIPYVKREIHTLRLVDTLMKSTPYKKENRRLLNDAFNLRGDCDDVILMKKGYLTDTSFANIALFDGYDWITPRVPLIYGVNRTQLVGQGKLIEKDILASELVNFLRVSLFNAMNDFGSIELDISAIRQ